MKGTLPPHADKQCATRSSKVEQRWPLPPSGRPSPSPHTLHVTRFQTLRLQVRTCRGAQETGSSGSTVASGAWGGWPHLCPCMWLLQ